jgi:uncharacterized membrane protein
MSKRAKMVIIAIVVLLLVVMLAFTQTTGKQGTPFNQNENVWGGGSRGNSGGSGGPDGYDGNPDDSGGYNGGWFNCH